MRMLAWPDELGVNVGSVDVTEVDEGVITALKPKKAIFVSSAPAWFDVSNLGIPVHERFSEGFEEKALKGRMESR